MKKLLIIFILTLLQGCIVDMLPPFIIVHNSTSDSINVEVKYKSYIRYEDVKKQAKLLKLDSTKKVYYFLVNPNGELILGRVFQENKFFFDKISYGIDEKKYILYENDIKNKFKKSTNYEYTIR